MQSPRVQFLWYWEGPVSRYYHNSPLWRSDRDLHLWCLRRGTLRLRWRNGDCLVPAGNWIVPPPFRRLASFSKDAEVWSLRFGAFLEHGQMWLCPGNPVVWPVGEGPLLRAMQLFRDCLRTDLGLDLDMKPDLERLTAPPLEALRFKTRLAEVLLALTEEAGESLQTGNAAPDFHPAVARAMTLMAERDFRKPLRQAELAAACGVGEPRLRALFRDHTGTTLKAWDMEQIDRSAKAALARELSAKEVAYAHGFSSPSHFSRWFRQRNQLSPGQWLLSGAKDGWI